MSVTKKDLLKKRGIAAYRYDSIKSRNTMDYLNFNFL